VAPQIKLQLTWVVKYLREEEEIIWVQLGMEKNSPHVGIG
jgi:hypothetical protein